MAHETFPRETGLCFGAAPPSLSSLQLPLRRLFDLPIRDTCYNHCEPCYWFYLKFGGPGFSRLVALTGSLRPLLGTVGRSERLERAAYDFSQIVQ